jgi:site-specific DNA recombinase
MNPIYAGAAAGLRWQVTTVRDHLARKQVRELRQKEDQIQLPEGVAPAMVDEATYAAVQARFRLNSEQARRHNSAPEASLLRGGFAKCGYCGSTMIVHRRPRYASYRCSKHLRIKDACPGATIAVKRLDEAVWRRVESILTQPAIIAAELRRMRQTDTTEVDVKRLGRQLVQVDRSISNLVERLAEAGPAVAKAVSEKLTALERQREQLSSEREAALTRRKGWAIGEQRVAEMELWCRSVGRRLGLLSYDERRLALQALNVRAYVWRADHSPYFEIEIGLPLDDGDPPDEANGDHKSRSTGNDQLVALRWTDTSTNQ